MDFLKRFWPSLLTLAIVLYATLASHPVGAEELSFIPYFDKWIHAIMMGGLLSAIAFDWQRCHKSHNVLTGSTLVALWVGIAAFSGIDELAQGYLTATRGCELLDFFADLAGATLAVFIAPPAIRTVLNIPRK